MKYKYIILAVSSGIIILIVCLLWHHRQMIANDESNQVVNSHWEIIQNADVGEWFRDIQFLDKSRGWGINKHGLWKTNNGGHNWIQVTTASKRKVLEHYEPQDYFEKIQFFNETEGWLLAADYLMHSTDGGKTWQTHQFEKIIIRSFRFLDAKNGWFVGEKLLLPEKEGVGETFRPVIYGTIDGGVSWRQKYIYKAGNNTYPAFTLYDVWPVSIKEIWAVGALILHSLDGGNTWLEIKIENRGNVGGMPIQVKFFDSAHGWIKTNYGAGALFTTDGGNRWAPCQGFDEAVGFEDIAYVNPTELWGIAGNTYKESSIYRSIDGGKSWTQMLKGDYSLLQYLKDENIIIAVGKAVAKYDLR